MWDRITASVHSASQRRTREPLVNMRTFIRRPVLTTNIATVLIGSAMISTFVLVPQLGQLPTGGEIGFGLSATEAGLLLAPGGLASLLVAPLVGRIGERSGSKAPFRLPRRRRRAARPGARARLGRPGRPLE